MKKINWLICSVGLGSIPLLARIFIYVLLRDRSAAIMVNPADCAVLGLVLNITNINELAAAQLAEKSWKTVGIGISIISIALYAVLFAVTVFQESSQYFFNSNAILISSFFLAGASIAFGFSVIDRLTKLKEVKRE